MVIFVFSHFRWVSVTHPFRWVSIALTHRILIQKKKTFFPQISFQTEALTSCMVCNPKPLQYQLLTTLRKKPLKNVVGKGESGSNQHFLLSPQC